MKTMEEVSFKRILVIISILKKLYDSQFVKYTKDYSPKTTSDEKFWFQGNRM